MNNVNVICFADGSVCENALFTGKNAEKRAEKHFVKRLIELKSPIDKDVPANVIALAIEDGEFKNNGCKLFLSHPLVRKS
jgi:hypothetical protein